MQTATCNWGDTGFGQSAVRGIQGTNREQNLIPEERPRLGIQLGSVYLFSVTLNCKEEEEEEQEQEEEKEKDFFFFFFYHGIVFHSTE